MTDKINSKTPTGVMNGYDATILNGFFRNFYMSRYGTTNSGKKHIRRKIVVLLESNFVGFFRAKKSYHYSRKGLFKT